MASSVETKLPQQYVDFDEYIDFQVQKTRGSIRVTDVLTGIAGVAVFVVVYLIAFSVLDHWVIDGGFSPFARGVMFAAVVSLSTAWLAWKAMVPGFRTVSRLFAAREIERSTPDLQSNLLNLVDLQHSGREVSESIQSAMEKRAAVVLSQVNVDHVVDRRVLMRLSYALLAAVIVLCAYTLFSPKQISMARALFPFSREGVATETEIVDVKPGDAEVLVRTQLEVTADLRGKIPENVQILYTTADRRYVDEPVQMHAIEDDQKRYRGNIVGENGRGILQDFSYRVAAGDATSPEFRVSVLQPPSAEVNKVQYEYPKYTQLEARTRNSGHIDALEGTKITLTATANTNVRSATVEFADDRGTSFAAESVPMTITSGTQLKGEFTLKIVDKVSPQSYRIRVVGKSGATDPNPMRYNIVVRPDLPPEAAIVDPTRDLEMPVNAVVPLLARAQDPDFAVKEVRLRVEKAGEIINRADPPLFDGSKRSVVVKHEMKLGSLGLQPGDMITYWVEARDNKDPYANGAASQRLNIRIGGRAPNEQVAEQLKADRERQEKKLKEAEQQRQEQQADHQDQPDEKAAKEGQQQPQRQDEQPQPGSDDKQGDESKAASEKSKDAESADKKSTDAGKNGPKQDQAKGESQQNKGDKPGESQPKDQAKTDPTSEADDDRVLDEVQKHFRDKAEKKDDSGDTPGESDKQKPGADKPKPDAPQDDNAKGGKESGDNKQPQQQPPDNQKDQGSTAQEQPKDGEHDKQPFQDSDKQDSADKNSQERDSDKKGTADQPPGKQSPQIKKREPGDDAQKHDADDNKAESTKQDDGKEPGKQGDEQPKQAAKKDPSAGDKGKSKEQSQPGGQSEPSKGTDNQNENNESPKTNAAADKNDPTQPAEKNGAKSKDDLKAGDSPKKDSEPAEDSANAREEKARGEEKGEGTPEKDPKAEPTPSKGDVERKQDAEPGATKAGKDDARKRPDVKGPSKQQPDKAKSSPKTANKDEANDDPSASPKDGASKQRPKDGAPKATDQQSPDERSEKSPANKKSSDPTKNSPDKDSQKNSDKAPPSGDPAEKGNDPEKSAGKEKSPSSEDGKKSGDAPEGQQQKPPADGKPGAKQDAEGKGGGEGKSEKGGNKNSGSAGSAAGEGQPGKPGARGGGGSGQGDSQPKDGGGDGNGKAAGKGEEGTGDKGSKPGSSESDDANLESARKATDLVLKQLKRELDRGDVDKEWLKKNGWTEDALKKFAERLQRQLDAPQDNSPEAQARRRQFEAMIENAHIASKTGKRQGTREFDRETEGIGPRRMEVPPEYREWFEAYSQEMLKRQKGGQPAKSAPKTQGK